MSDKKISLLDSLGGLLLFACSITLVSVAVIFSVRSCSQEKEHVDIVFSVKVDSTGVISAIDKNVIDSLTQEIQNANYNLYERYNHTLRAEEDEKSYFTIGGIFLTIVLSVFGFFGYRSFKSIEERADILAQDKAQERVELGIKQMKSDIKTIAEQEVEKWGKEETKKQQQQNAMLLSETIYPAMNDIKDFGLELKEIKERLSKLEISASNTNEINETIEASEEAVQSLPKAARNNKPFAVDEKKGGQV